MLLHTSLHVVLFFSFACGNIIQQAARAVNQTAANTYDYIVVGSGPGGGPLSARLAQSGFSVLLIDAGDDHGDDPFIQVPILSAQASEYTPIHWQFFVSHFKDNVQAQKDSKYTWKQLDGRYYVGTNPPSGSTPLGISYPRTGTLGGCAEHNAMILIYPHESDWSHIADITGDDSWSPDNMRNYWTKLENNQYLIQGTTTGHGFSGWLDISLTDLGLVLKDSKVLSMVQGAATALGKGLLGSLLSTSRDTTTGIYQVPISVTSGPKTRSGPRKLILDTANAVNSDGSKKYKLDIRLNTLVSRVIFDNSTVGGTPRAIGVEYLSGQSLYRADPRSSSSTTPTGSGSFFASKEVILSGGVFNTPQLLKLSGVGPRQELQALQIPVILDAPAVGTNLQDRYEVSAVGTTNSDYVILKGCTFLNTTDDPCYAQWKNNPLDKGAYGSNGFALAITQKTSVAEPTADDAIIVGVPVNFYGFFPGYSNRTSADARHWTWLSLKAHSRNNAGTVTLKTNDPRDMPQIDFNNFQIGADLDLQASYESLQLARKMFSTLLPLGGTFQEIVPGHGITSEADVKDWIKQEAWGHHASCTVPIGANEDTNSVLDSKFRVRGVAGLRVVDASVFPRIPGFFVVSAVYMISEKAADVIIQDAKAS